jgi:hypothetical protein
MWGFAEATVKNFWTWNSAVWYKFTDVPEEFTASGLEVRETTEAGGFYETVVNLYYIKGRHILDDIILYWLILYLKINV